jgi:ABC-type glycerol-3-phosphate transport system substrate-binding protein
LRFSRIAILLVAALLASSACGDSGSDAEPAEADKDFARYSAREVADHFQRAIGVELERESGPTDLETLKIALTSGPVLTRSAFPAREHRR